MAKPLPQRSAPLDPDRLAQILRDLHAGSRLHANDAIVPPGKRKCPICSHPMRVTASHDLSVDVCPTHGVWLDRGELAKLIDRVYYHRRADHRAAAGQRHASRNQTRQTFTTTVRRILSALGR